MKLELDHTSGVYTSEFCISFKNHHLLCLFKLGRGSFGEPAFTGIHCHSSQRWEFTVQSISVTAQKHGILCIQSRWCSLSSEVSNLDILSFIHESLSCYFKWLIVRSSTPMHGDNWEFKSGSKLEPVKILLKLFRLVSKDRQEYLEYFQETEGERKIGGSVQNILCAHNLWGSSMKLLCWEEGKLRYLTFSSIRGRIFSWNIPGLGSRVLPLCWGRQEFEQLLAHVSGEKAKHIKRLPCCSQWLSRRK